MRPKDAHIRVAVCLLLASFTLLCYWSLCHHSFISFDDPDYIVDNSNVTAGLTWAGLAWAIRTGQAGNWHPLTWFSHMLDCQLYGLNPAGHHFSNLLFHTANALLLFLLLSQITGTIWRSALVSALFAWHPLHVESVAWAAERKDVLSTFFFLLSLLAYAGYCKRAPLAKNHDEARPPLFSSRNLYAIFYIASLCLFAFGLMSKPMVVTLPCVLLLLEFWPLGRFQISVTGSSPGLLKARLGNFKLLLVEKLPFFALALLASIITFNVQKTGGAVATLDGVPLGTRMAAALVSYLRYVFKLLWPADLAIIYPYQDHVTLTAAGVAAGLLILWSVLAFSHRAQQPYFITGWFWFLGTLVPVIGLIQVGSQSMADRYTYIPSIGLFIFLVWGVSDIVQRLPRLKLLVVCGAGAACVICLSITSLQLTYWQNGIKLFQHAVDVTQNNYIACEHLGSNLYQAGRKDEALFYYKESLRIRPHRPDAEYNVGTLLLELDHPKEAEAHLSAAAQLDPHNPQTQLNLGLALISQGPVNYPQAALAMHKARELALAAGQQQVAKRAAELLKRCQPSPSSQSKVQTALLSSSSNLR